MRIYEPLNKVLNQETKVGIIRFLFNTRAEWSGRQIAREIGVSPATCHKALRELYSEKILLLRSVGVTHLYKLNQKNYIVKNILSELFQKERLIPYLLNKTIINDIKSKLREKVISVILFGSIARKKESPVSDIDLMVVIKRSSDKKTTEKVLDGINGKIIENFNSRVEPYILTINELIKKSKLSIIKEINKTGKLLWGKSLSELL